MVWFARAAMKNNQDSKSALDYSITIIVVLTFFLS
jgi:hypothetical protein